MLKDVFGCPYRRLEIGQNSKGFVWKDLSTVQICTVDCFFNLFSPHPTTMNWMVSIASSFFFYGFYSIHNRDYNFDGLGSHRYRDEYLQKFLALKTASRPTDG